jgi:hypothetical protein
MPEQSKLSPKEFASRVKAKYPEYQNLDDLELTRRVLNRFPEYRGVIDADGSLVRVSGVPPAQEPASKLSPSQFASRVKAKYPEYADLDDVELARRVVAKFPEYRDAVDLDSRSTLGRVADIGIPTALRVGGAVGGAILGGATTFGLGTIGGGAAGGAAGELLAEAYEKARGRRESINPVQVAVQGGLSAIPGTRAANLGRRVLQSAGLGAIGTGATELAEGRSPQIKDLAIGAAVGGGFGAIPFRPRLSSPFPQSSGFARYARFPSRRLPSDKPSS